MADVGETPEDMEGAVVKTPEQELAEMRALLVSDMNGQLPDPGAAIMHSYCQKIIDETAAAGKINPLETKGFLAVMLWITHRAKNLPGVLNDKTFFTDDRGNPTSQVSGLGSGPNKVLRIWGVNERYEFGTESGRTSRGTPTYCKAWKDILNEIRQAHGEAGLGHLMSFWIEKTEQLFASSPIELKFMAKQTLRSFLRRLIEDVRKNEKDARGTKLVGAMMQHIVGAKLDIVLGEGRVDHHSSTQSDVQTGRDGDFTIGDFVIHVTSAPSEKLVQKCVQNVKEGMRPIIITLAKKVRAAEGLCENVGSQDDIEVFDFEAFIVHNMVEQSILKSEKPRVTVEALITRYNQILDAYDPHGLRLEVVSGEASKSKSKGKGDSSYTDESTLI